MSFVFSVRGGWVFGVDLLCRYPMALMTNGNVSTRAGITGGETVSQLGDGF